MTNKMGKGKKKISDGEQVCFEEALGKLELIVNNLETGELSLEDALEKFEEGIGLSRFCVQRIAEIEAKVDLLLTNEQGQPKCTPVVLGGEAGC